MKRRNENRFSLFPGWMLQEATKPGFSFVWLILCSIFCYGCIFAFVVFVSVFQYQAKRLAGKNVSEMTYFMLIRSTTTQSVNVS